MTGNIKTAAPFLKADIPLELLYEDEALLVLNKPAGMLSVPGRGADKQECLTAWVQQVYPQARVVHRLDMATSGIMVMARSLEVQRHLQRQFEQRQVSKRYIALIKGRLEPERDVVDLPLMADWPNRPRQKVDLKQGKPSLTRYQVVQYLPQQDISRVVLEPVTGRSHQLRVHMQALGHPIVGDRLYGGAYQQSGRLLLHAEAISFRHPLRAEMISLTCNCPF
jgi:tRNA pseudouridine32 synthase/23S rRNA pseudouridine746 synthase